MLRSKHYWSHAAAQFLLLFTLLYLSGIKAGSWRWLAFLAAATAYNLSAYFQGRMVGEEQERRYGRV